MVLGQLDVHKIIKLVSFLTPYTKIYSKWIIDLIIRAKTIKILKENIAVKPNDLGWIRQWLS